MRVPRTQSDPVNAADSKGHPTAYLNRESPWWDGSQIYGRNLEIQHTLRSPQDGKLLVDERGLLPLAAKQEQAERGKVDAVEKVAFSNNWWLGLGLMHVIFTQEHNAICDKLKSEYPLWDSEQLFNKARLVNTALIAKIHTVEWTTAILGHPALQISMNANWWGLVGEKINKLAGRISKSEIISGIPGSATNHFGVPYSLTEEFVSVYRMHPLLPDSFIFHSVDNGVILGEASLGEAVGKGARKIMEEIDISDLFYSMGIAHPGAITLMNYPNFLRNLPGHGDYKMDLAAVDILRDRERGVPRYNDFRELLRLPRIKTFSQLTPNSELAKKLETVYEGKIDDVDLMIGMFAEQPPKGFGFSDTAFRIFILMASRRLNSDRFFTVDFTPEVYSPVGFKWVADNNMRSVLLRHYPKLEPALRGNKNAFAPWNRLSIG
jgi:Animal haem peroxidase